MANKRKLPESIANPSWDSVREHSRDIYQGVELLEAE